MFARVPEVAAQTDRVRKQLDVLLDDDELDPQVRDEPSKAVSMDLAAWAAFPPVEVLLRMLICKHLSQCS